MYLILLIAKYVRDGVCISAMLLQKIKATFHSIPAMLNQQQVKIMYYQMSYVLYSEVVYSNILCGFVFPFHPS
jgi:hypothetical protein